MDQIILRCFLQSYLPLSLFMVWSIVTLLTSLYLLTIEPYLYGQLSSASFLCVFFIHDQTTQFVTTIFSSENYPDFISNDCIYNLRFVGVSTHT